MYATASQRLHTEPHSLSDVATHLSRSREVHQPRDDVRVRRVLADDAAVHRERLPPHTHPLAHVVVQQQQPVGDVAP